MLRNHSLNFNHWIRYHMKAIPSGSLLKNALKGFPIPPGICKFVIFSPVGILIDGSDCAPTSADTRLSTAFLLRLRIICRSFFLLALLSMGLARLAASVGVNWARKVAGSGKLANPAKSAKPLGRLLIDPLPNPIFWLRLRSPGNIEVCWVGNGGISGKLWRQREPAPLPPNKDVYLIIGETIALFWISFFSPKTKILFQKMISGWAIKIRINNRWSKPVEISQTKKQTAFAHIGVLVLLFLLLIVIYLSNAINAFDCYRMCQIGNRDVIWVVSDKPIGIVIKWLLFGAIPIIKIEWKKLIIFIDSFALHRNDPNLHWRLCILELKNELVFDASVGIYANKTNLESALKGNVKRSSESATAFLVQDRYICSRTLNIYIGLLFLYTIY